MHRFNVHPKYSRTPARRKIVGNFGSEVECPLLIDRGRLLTCNARPAQIDPQPSFDPLPPFRQLPKYNGRRSNDVGLDVRLRVTVDTVDRYLPAGLELGISCKGQACLVAQLIQHTNRLRPANATSHGNVLSRTIK